MDFKIKIIQALDELDKLTGEGSTKHLRENIAKESDQSKLFLKFQSLRETLAAAKGQKDDVSFTMAMPDGAKKTFKNLKEFFEDKQTQDDIKSYIRASQKRAISVGGQP